MKAVNLLPPDLRGTPTASAPVVAADVERSAGPYIVLGALALCVVAIAGYVLVGNTIKDRQAQLVDMTNREQAVTAQAAKLKPYADFETLANERVQTVRDLAGQRFDWEQSFRDLSRAIPADVTLNDLSASVSPSGGTTGGSGSSGFRGAISAPAIEIKGCADSQRDVAALMARLKNIDGVTRVSLSKSEKSAESSGTTAAADSNAGATTEGGCGNGNPPQFEMVMFFEGKAAATQAADASSGSASTTAAPSPTPSATPASGSDASTTTSTQGGVTP